MFWIVLFLVSVALVATGIFLIAKGINFGCEVTGMCLIVVFSITSVAAVIYGIIFLTNIKQCKITTQETIYYREQLVERGNVIDNFNAGAVTSWYDDVQKFNRKLKSEQLDQEAWGNFFEPHDPEYMKIEEIDTSKVVIPKDHKVLELTN